MMEEAYWANKLAVEAAQASGLTREQIVATAMACMPCAGVYNTVETETFGDLDWGLAMAWLTLQGRPMTLGSLVRRADAHGWSDVEACYGTPALPAIKEWAAAVAALGAEPRWAPLDSPARLRMSEAYKRLTEVLPPWALK